jgi:hypothetical protein
MSFFQLFAIAHRDGGFLRNRRRSHARRASPRIESLDSRILLSCAEISGFVYHDANDNGIFDSGETPIANSKLELHDSANHLVATTTTDAHGFYSFMADPRINTSPVTKEYDVSFPEKATDWTDTKTLPQLDPVLGTLTAVDIIANDPLTSLLKIENVDSAPATIHATVTATATLSGPSLASLVSTLSLDKTFHAAPFDGTIDFDAPSGVTYGPETVPGSNTITLTNPGDLAPYIGKGTVAFTETTHSTSAASGSANLVLQVNTSVSAQMRVIYHYIPSNCLLPGDYTIVQPELPPGYLNGWKTSGNIVPIPGSNTVNFIHVTLGTSSLTNNNFGEVRPGSLAGYVYFDANNDGIKQPSEPGIANIGVRLTGIDDQGNVINVLQQTAPDGSYLFTNLRPGIYTLTELGVPGYLPGKDTIGTPGGATTQDHFANVKLASGVQGINNNFGELKPSSLAGYVYLDDDNDGIKQPGEPGIPGVKVTLTGIDDLGHAVSQTQYTAADGSYRFTNLRPGVYTLNEYHPAGFLDGKDTIGTPGGITSHDQFSNIVLASGVDGMDNNFGELLQAGHAAPPPVNPRPPTIVGKGFFLASRAFRGG